ncbi:MAG: rhomboid family intramembrane serine protease, partial [Gemmatimonadota bacterium]
PLTPWVRRLLVANAVIFFLPYLVPDFQAFYNYLVFDTSRFLSEPWTGITYQFLHAGFGPLAFNMLALFFFGPRLEERMGGGHFLAMYLGAGFAGAVLSLLLALGASGPMRIVGASGAVYGVLAAYAAIWPRTVIYIWAVLPVQAWVLALVMVLASLWFGLSGGGGNVAHFAHLGGLAFGYAYIKWWDWKKGAAKREFKKKLERPVAAPEPRISGGENAALRRWEAIDTAGLHELNREEVETLLSKARTDGVRALTPSERQFLERMIRA